MTDDELPGSSDRVGHQHHRRIGWMLVALQGALLVGVFFGPGSRSSSTSRALKMVSQVSSLIGAVLVVFSAVALGRRLTAHPEPNGHGSLRVTGLYRLMRHPMYTGVMAFSIGSALSSRSVFRMITCAALMVLFNVKARFEERSLTAHFPDYPAYAKRVPRFVPIPIRLTTPEC